MILGGAVSLLLLIGGPQAPPDDRPMSGDGYLAEYPIEIGDPWDMGGGGGGRYTNCKVTGPLGPGQTYCVEHAPKDGAWRHCAGDNGQPMRTRADTDKWKSDHC